jgi:WD40 repeat protein
MVATGACDNIIRLRSYVDEDWKEVEELKAMQTHSGSDNTQSAHSSRSGHYCFLFYPFLIRLTPNNLIPYNVIASCSEDHHIFIWKQNRIDQSWEVKTLWEDESLFDAPIWRVSWSTTGNILAVACGDHKVTLWKQALDEAWMQISTVDET